MPPSKPKVLVIALAEATLDLILPWAESGRLPHFAAMMKEGCWGPLRSRIPFVTPQIWATILTGTNPGRHGLYDFWQRGADGRFREVNGSDLREKPVWGLLSDGGFRCGVINVPFTYPPQAINGFMISGEDAPGPHRSIATPPELYDEIVRKFGRYRLKDIFPGGRRKSDYLTLVEEDVRKQTDVLEYLVAEKEWNFFMTFYSATAITQHYFWGDMESGDGNNPYRRVVETAYRRLDDAVGRLIQAAGPDTTVFVISEFGAGPMESGVQINTWLQKEGFLTYKKNGLSPPGKSGARKPKGAGLRPLVAYLRTTVQGHLPKSMYYRVNRYLKPVKTWIQSFLAGSDIDWDQTRAFARGKEGEIYINLKGRDPRGIVEPGEEYETVRNQIIERLSGLKNPKTAESAVDRVYRREELYQGPMMESAPDLIVAWRDGKYQPTESDRDKDSVFVTRWREYMNWPTTGSHRIDGILFARGPGIRSGIRIEGARIIDLMPTWLSVLNRKVPPGTEGRALSEMFETKNEAAPHGRSGS